MTETSKDVRHCIGTVDLPDGFVGIQVNKAKVEAKKIDHPPVGPDELSLRDPHVTVLIQILDDLGHLPKRVAPSYPGIGFRGCTGQFEALRAIPKPEKGEEPLFPGIVVEACFFKAGKRQAGLRTL